MNIQDLIQYFPIRVFGIATLALGSVYCLLEFIGVRKYIQGVNNENSGETNSSKKFLSYAHLVFRVIKICLICMIILVILKLCKVL